VSNTETSRAGASTRRLGRLIATAPDVILLVAMVLCLAVTVAVTANMFTPWLVALLVVLLLPIFLRFIPAPPSVGRSEVLGSALSLLGAAIWAALNMPYASQLLWVTRDPGIYTVTGIWLSKHHSGGIDAHMMFNLADRVPGISESLVPFTPVSTGVMHGQGGLTVSGLVGIGGWVAGLDGALRANIVVGAVALVGIYALARRFVRPLLALVTEVALGLAVAFLDLMRAPYSESILLVAAIAGLIWFVAALREGRTGLAVAGGLVIGVGAMARIDGAIVLVGSGLLVALLVAIVSDADLARLRRLSVAFLGAALLSCLGGLSSIYLSQRRYANDLRSQTLMLWAAAVACLVLAAAVLMARSARRLPQLGECSELFLRRVGIAAGAAVPLLFVVWWSRPLWWQGHFVVRGSPYATAVEALQKQLGLAVDGTRSYDELTLHWVAWYFGWATVVLAAVGLAIMLGRGIARRELSLLVVVVPALMAAVLYLDKVSVTPDQVWAYRRLLPIITPGFLVGAVFALEWWLRRSGTALKRYGVVLVLVVIMVASPFKAWSGLVRTVDGGGAQTLVEQLCDRLTGDPVLVSTGQTPANIPLTIRTVCNREVISGDTKNPALLRRLQAVAGSIQVVAFSKQDLPKGSEARKPDVTGTLRFWNHGLVSVPTAYSEVSWKVWVGHLDDGRFVQDRVS
jgi:hypothetical protein